MILLDLFSGIGGFHKGLTDAGFEFEKVYYSELNKYAIANYKYNYAKAEYIGAVEHVLKRGIKRPDIITFGSPCQDFSLAGSRAGLAGARSSLIKKAITIITHFRPSVFIWENVKGAFTSNNSKDFWAIIQAFTNIGGYQIEWQLLNTNWVLPQNRERLYLIGRIANKCRRQIFPIEKEIKMVAPKRSLPKVQTASCLLSLENSNVAKGEYKGMNLIVQIPRGKNKGGLFDISPTITCNSFEQNNFLCFLSEHSYGTGNDNIPYIKNIRKLTEIECERLQGFPDDWTKYGNFKATKKEISATQRYKMIGNAVTVKIVELVGKSILKNTKFKI